MSDHGPDADDFAEPGDVDGNRIETRLHDDSGDVDGNVIDEVAAVGNRLLGATPKVVLEYIARSLADDPDGVFVDAQEGRGEVTLRLHVSPGDMGRVIGKHGRVAQAIRQVVRAAGAREGVRAVVDIVD